MDDRAAFFHTLVPPQVAPARCPVQTSPSSLPARERVNAITSGAAEQVSQLMIYVETHVAACRNAHGGRTRRSTRWPRCPALFRRAVGDGLIKEADNPAQKVAKPRRLLTTRRALPDVRLAQINEVTAALCAATLAAMLEPARPRRAEPGQAMAAATQQSSRPHDGAVQARQRQSRLNPDISSSLLQSVTACTAAWREIRHSYVCQGVLLGPLGSVFPGFAEVRTRQRWAARGGGQAVIRSRGRQGGEGPGAAGRSDQGQQRVRQPL